MADTWLTDTPGCLQSFGGRTGIKRDLPLMLANWKDLIGRKDEIKHYIPGHWNGELSYNGFVDRFKYLVTLKKEVKKAAKEGRDLKAVLADLNLEGRFPHLAGKPGFTIGFVHNNNILNLWTEETGAESASTVLAKMIEKKGLEAALAEFKNLDSKKYYRLEGDFNQLGYRYMGQDKMDEAIAVFKLNVKMYPESWNVYDSLGEAYLKAEKKDLALKSYEHALKLNDQKTEGAKKQYQYQQEICKKLKTGK
jgi:tetratricopeptide (TPR) repeat protein